MVGPQSRYRWCDIHQDETGRRFYSERPRFAYRNLPDNRLHTVRDGERLWHIAQIHYRQLERAGNLWWVIADFQPEPIHDVTIALETGRVLVVPSARTVEELVFATSRAQDLS